MTIPSTLESLSQTIGSNVPAEGDGTLMTSVNDGLRAAYGFTRQTVSSGSDIASASTITPPSTASSFTITGTTTITAIASTNSWNGRIIWLRFDGATPITHSSSLVLPGATNITSAAGDYGVFRQHSSGVWHCVAYQKASGIPLTQGGTSATFLRGDGSFQNTLLSSFTVSAALGSKIEIQDSGNSNRGGYLQTGASSFLISSNSGGLATVIGQDGSAVITIDTNRRVTIDTSSGTNPLTANCNTSGDSWVSHLNGDGTGNCGFRTTCDGGVTAFFGSVANSYGHFGTSSSHPMRFKANNTDIAAYDSNGNWSFGATAPAGSEKVLVKQSAGASTPGQRIWHATTTGDGVFIEFATEGSYTSRGTISYNRSGGQIAYNTTSDYRSKTIIGDLENSGDVIDQIKVYLGRMNWATQERPMIIAHELQEVAPYAVSGEKDAVDDFGTPRYQQVDMTPLIPLMIAEIQDLRRRISVLEPPVL